MRWRRRLLRRQRRVEHERRVQLVTESLLRFVDGGWRAFADRVDELMLPVAQFAGRPFRAPRLQPDRAAAEVVARKYLSTDRGQGAFARGGTRG